MEWPYSLRAVTPNTLIITLVEYKPPENSKQHGDGSHLTAYGRYVLCGNDYTATEDESADPI